MEHQFHRTQKRVLSEDLLTLFMFTFTFTFLLFVLMAHPGGHATAHLHAWMRLK